MIRENQSTEFIAFTLADLDDREVTVLEMLADKYGITLVSAEDNAKANGEHRNHMASAGSMIFLNRFDDPDLEIVAFFHELGHVEAGRTPYLRHSVCLCKLSQEAMAWEIGLSLAAKEGYEWDYYSKQMDYARQCLLSYLHHEGHLGGFR